MHDYEGGNFFATQFFVSPTESPEELTLFKTCGWWHGNNSWWERVGWTVKSRSRGCGFELASGDYWPPFAWQHPIVPFDIVVVPIWSLILSFTGFGSWLTGLAWRWDVAGKAARKDHATSTSS